MSNNCFETWTHSPFVVFVRSHADRVMVKQQCLHNLVAVPSTICKHSCQWTCQDPSRITSLLIGSAFDDGCPRLRKATYGPDYLGITVRMHSRQPRQCASFITTKVVHQIDWNSNIHELPPHQAWYCGVSTARLEAQSILAETLLFWRLTTDLATSTLSYYWYYSWLPARY